MPSSVTIENPTLSEVTGIFRAVFNDPGLELTLRSGPDDIPGWDSMTHIALLVEFECRFGIQFQTAEIESLYSVGELLRAIEMKRLPAG
jgi:acyl carrier protein